MWFKTKEGSSIFDNASPRLTFLLGLVSGLAVLGLLGLFILLGIFLSQGNSIVSVARRSDAAAAETNNNNPDGQTPEQRVAITVKNTDHIRGNPQAPVTVVEFSDFECPFCGSFHPTTTQLLNEYKNKVRLVFKYFPLDSLHQNARPAAEAAECAAEQGKFWEFADQLFQNQERLGTELYNQIAASIKLNANAFASCVAARKYKQRVEDDLQEGLGLGVRGTPSNFVNGISIPGAVPYAQLKSIVDGELTK